MYIISIAAIKRKFVKDNHYTFDRIDATKFPTYESAYAYARTIEYKMSSITIVKIKGV